MKKGEDVASLGDLAIELGINKSMLNYYCNQGLLNPEYLVGKMKVFKRSEALKDIKKIIAFKKEGKKIKDILEIL